MPASAIYPGSFDPITYGHLDILQRATEMFDKVILTVAVNTQKKYVFEIENSTSITSAIERASHIPEEYDTKRLIVIPEERQKILERKMNEPMFKEGYNKYKWQTIHYDALEDFYNLHKNDKAFNQNDFKNLK